MTNKTPKQYKDVQADIWLYTIVIGYGLLFFIFGFDFFFADDGNDWRVFGLFIIPAVVAKILDALAKRKYSE